MATATPSQTAKNQKQAALDQNKDINLLNDQLQSHQDAAGKQLTAELRNKNKNETTFEFTMLGDPNWCAGIVVTLDGSFGVYTGNYLIDKCVHRIGRQGYTTEISAHKCLKGHDAGSAPTKSAPKSYSPGASVPAPNLSGSPTPLSAQLGSPLPPATNVALASRQ